MNTTPPTPSIEQKISERIDPEIAGALAITDRAGGLAFANAGETMEFAKLMAISSLAVPKHLRGNPGACLAVVIQAIEWRLSPYAVANKSYAVNDRLAFESQLIQAVILQRAPIKGRLQLEYRGEGEQRICRVWATLQNGDVVEYTSPPRGRITPQNSPLWKSDPDQQHFYYSARALCRRHFPDVLLGIYARDELEDSPRIGPDRARDVTPAKTLAEKLDALAKSPADEAAEIDAEIAVNLAGIVEGFDEAFPDAPEPEAQDVLDEPVKPVEPLNVGKARQRGREDRAGGYQRISKWKTDSAETRAYFEGYDEPPA